MSMYDVPVSGLYLLAKPSAPEPVRKEIIQPAEAGERFTHAQVQEMIADGTRGRVAH